MSYAGVKQDNVTFPDLPEIVIQNPQFDGALGAVVSSQNSITISWTPPTSLSGNIIDYYVEYRVVGQQFWSTFVDGVSTNLNMVIEGLSGGLEYQIRMKAVDDLGNETNYSDPINYETKPNLPFFDPTVFKKMLLVPATGSRVVSMVDGNQITLPDGSVITLNKAEFRYFASSQGQVLEGTGPFDATGYWGGTNVEWMGATLAGKAFSCNSVRNNPQRFYVYAFEDSNVEAKSGNLLLDSSFIPAGTFATLEFNFIGAHQLTSDGYIIAFFSSNSTVDAKLLVPDATEIIGVPSSTGRITTSSTESFYNGIHSNSVFINTTRVPLQGIQTITPQGTSSYYRCEAVRLESSDPISGASFADANGGKSSPFYPTALMSNTGATTGRLDYVCFVSKTPGTIQEIDSSGNIVSTLTLTNSGGDPQAPFKAYKGPTNAVTDDGGRVWYSPDTVFAGWYQHNGGSSSLGYGNDDECLMSVEMTNG